LEMINNGFVCIIMTPCIFCPINIFAFIAGSFVTLHCSFDEQTPAYQMPVLEISRNPHTCDSRLSCGLNVSRAQAGKLFMVELG
jgi:hypothetical protein